MEFAIEGSDGTKLRFSGTRAELDVVLELVRADGAALLAALAGTSAASGSDSPVGSKATPSSVRELQELLDRAGATTDVERVAIMAHFAAASTGGGLTDEKAAQWYSELGIPKPGRWPSTFSNTRVRGYIHASPDGWRPTPAAENLAIHGLRRQSSRRRKRGGSEA